MYEGEVSDFLRAKLTREGKHEAKRQLDRVNKGPGAAVEGARREVLADAPREEGQGHRPLPRSVSPGKLETSMRKATGRMTRNRAAFLMLVVDNDR